MSILDPMTRSSVHNPATLLHYMQQEFGTGTTFKDQIAMCAEANKFFAETQGASYSTLGEVVQWAKYNGHRPRGARGIGELARKMKGEGWLRSMEVTTGTSSRRNC